MREGDIPLIGPLLKRLMGSRNERFVKQYNNRVARINALEPQIRVMSDEQLRGKLSEFRVRLEKGESLDQIMVEAFAVAREAMDRSVGIRNIFNPKHGFDPGRLPESVRGVYAETKAKMDATPPAAPTGPYLGQREPVPGWQQVDLPPALCEAVRELYPESKPPFRARPFDVQLVGAMVLSQGKIAEMKTGEGKTIVAPLACYLACVERLKCHVVTVNDYLVQRDRDWTAPFFRAVGMTVGAIHPMHMQDENEKRAMYRCDVVYGTTSEFGFDYLRDNMKQRVEDQVQRKRQFAVVDEVDSILIDEARTPLIISGPAHEDNPRYELADSLARHLVAKQKPWNDADAHVQEALIKIKQIEGDIRQLRDRARLPELQKELAAAKAELPRRQAERDRHTQFYEVKMERKQAFLTHDGVAEAQRAAGVGSFYVDQNIDLPHLLEQALRAHVVYELDRDYIVMETPDPRTGVPTPSIVIVDVNTGRPMIGRQWSDGLHQAIECKEKVPIKEETQTVATITIQNFFKMYKRLAGMTGTADTEAQEFHDIYKLDVVAIPTHKPVRRVDHNHVVYITAKDKWNAIVEEIRQNYLVGRPVLVGTTSVEKSEMLSKLLTTKHGIKHEVLNAKPEKIAREAEIVEQAGQLGSVMIATNMAGRGTDIKLGAVTRAQLVEHWLRSGLAPRTLRDDMTTEQLREEVYRKIAPQELGVAKRELEGVTYTDLEMRLLRHWATIYTIMTPKEIERSTAEALRVALDQAGRCLIHRLDWFTSVEEIGGLQVIGTERHESRRIDNQLRGRSGRQGDRGASRFFVSLEDDMMKYFAGETLQNFLARFGGIKEGDSIEHPWITKSIERVQRKVEEHYFQMRKNLLEYDEVREHQRQRFYGTRQRVLEGRDVKGLILEWIQEAVEDNAETFLSPDYSAQCAAEFAKAKLDCDIPADRLRGQDLDEMVARIKQDAKDDARAMIDVTIGEYIPAEGSEVTVDFDAAGLASWARGKFGVELDAAGLHAEGRAVRRKVQDALTRAAFDRIDQTELVGLEQFLEADYGIKQFCMWAKDKFLIEITPDEVKSAMKPDEERTPVKIVMEKAKALYQQREVNFPIEYAIEMTKQMMQYDRQQAFNQLIAWANSRYRMGWTAEQVMKTTPQQLRADLNARAEKFVAEGELDREITQALACPDDAALDAHLKARFGPQGGLPETMRWLDKDERPDAVRALMENRLRAEMLQFERMILLRTMDDAWKDHLYAMDQLRESIGFRAFSQNDPRIEFKREGSHMFSGMMQSVRDRVTDYIFKARLAPQTPPPTPAMSSRLFSRGAPPARPTAPASASATLTANGLSVGGSAVAGGGISTTGGMFSTFISGPGIGSSRPPAPNTPPADPATPSDNQGPRV